MNRGSANTLREPEVPPRELCGYSFIRWLKQGRTALCRSDHGRMLVLKQVDADCLLEGDLHPDIRERLARIRELPHRTVATLTGVERDTTGRIYSVWEYIEGTSFQAWVCNPMRDEQHAARMMRELVIAVEGMHGQGITHGALHDGNVLVDAAGEVRLLDVSPLLFADEREDAKALGTMLRGILQTRAETETRIGQALLASVSSKAELRDISAAISRAIQSESPADSEGARKRDMEEEQARRHALRLAIIAAIAAAAFAALAWYMFSDTTKAPPQAPKEAMQQRK